MRTILFITLLFTINSVSALNFFGRELASSDERLHANVRLKGERNKRLPLQDFHDQALQLLGGRNRIRTVQDAELFLLNLMGMGVSEDELFQVLNSIRAGGVTIAVADDALLYSPFTNEQLQALHEGYTRAKTRLGTIPNLSAFVTDKAEQGYKRLFPAHERFLRMPTLVHSIVGSLSSGAAAFGKRALSNLDHNVAMLKKHQAELHKKLPDLYRLYRGSELFTLRKKALPRDVRFLVDQLFHVHRRLLRAKSERKRAYAALFGGSFVLFLTVLSHIQRNPVASWTENFSAREALRTDATAAKTPVDTASPGEHLKVQ